MKTRLAVTALIFMVVQGVLFGVGALLVLATPMRAEMETLLPYAIVVSFMLAAPLAWIIAPRMMQRYSQRRPVWGVERPGH
ncbi:MAG: hypothetical protein Q8S29_04700 [Phreatobacter sp.]|nr:hypothetical protein [Phreatobacter sp.]